jgi:DNA-binding MarR family transcriptional regulator
MTATPSMPQLIGQTERALGALMRPVLERFGATFHQWVALSVTTTNGGSMNRADLIAYITDALQIDDDTVEATLAELAAAGLLETSTESVVALNEAGRNRYDEMRTAVGANTVPLFADIPDDDLATARRVLTTVAERAANQLVRA